MNLGRVIGTVVATQKYEGLTGCKLLLVQPLDHAQRKVGDYLVAVDTVRAGVGELIYFVNSREAALALEPSFVPVDAAIVGIVDDIATSPLPAIEADVFFHTGRAAGPGPGAATKSEPAKEPVPETKATTASETKAASDTKAAPDTKAAAPDTKAATAPDTKAAAPDTKAAMAPDTKAAAPEPATSPAAATKNEPAKAAAKKAATKATRRRT